MVGEGVLLECLQHPDVEQVLVVNRKPGGVAHPKLKEIVHKDFFNLGPIEKELAGYNACFFCLGVSSVGMDKDEYRHLTYDLTMNFAQTLLRYNTDLTFGYVSGGGTDSTERGRLAWARVKGATENALMRMPFRRAYMFRPGFMKPIEGSRNTKGYYRFIAPLYPVLRALMPQYVSTLQELALAMIKSVTQGYEKNILEVKDIVQLAKA